MIRSVWTLLSPKATLSRARYFLIGILLTPIKLALDWLVAAQIFKRPWSPLRYALTGQIGGLFALDEADRIFYATMLAVALPFLVVGLVLTVQRLRDAGWPPWAVLLFFAPPPINIVFFLILSWIPSRPRVIDASPADATYGPEFARIESTPKIARPGFAIGRALLAIVIPLPIVGFAAYFGTHLLRDYGWSLFVGLPFVAPMISVVIYGAGREVTAKECRQVGWLWILVATFTLIATAFEGLICIVMMLPLAVPIAVLGSMVGYFIVELGHRPPRDLARLTILLLALLPAMVGAEHLTTPEPLEFLCETSVDIDAPPEKVWKNVVSFSDLPTPADWLFHTGVAYPIRARIAGTGVGAIRRCEFSTGTFVEPIEVWDEPRLLRFSVTSSPSPMEEWNPLFAIHPPHLDGFLISKHGQFALTPLPGGRTLLKGSTLYQHGLWPAWYWRLWSDPIIHRIHDRVLRHIKTLSEE